MPRKGIDLVALFYFITGLACLIPYFQYGHFILFGSGMMYALPFLVVGGGLGLRKEWGRKLAILLSPLLVLIVLPLLFRKQLTFVYAFPWVGVTYPPSSAATFRGFFGLMMAGHLIALIYLLRGDIKAAFPPTGTRAPSRRKEAGPG